MEDLLNIICTFQTQPVADAYVNTDSDALKLMSEKDQLESVFAEILHKNQEIPFDNFMDELDKCNNDLQKIAFRKGLETGLNILSDTIDKIRKQIQ